MARNTNLWLPLRFILRPQNNENIEEQRQNSRQSIEHESHDTNYVKISYIK